MAANTGSTKWTIRNIYLYLVCFVCLMIMIFTAAELVTYVVQMNYPPPVYKPPQVEQQKPGAEQKQEVSNYDYKYQRAFERYQAVRELTKDVVLLLIVVPLYFYHWRQVQKENAKHEELKE